MHNLQILVFFSLMRNVFSCTPSITAPFFQPAPLPPINLSPQLPPIAFQMDSAPAPHHDDYVDEPISVQKDSIIPLQGEKLKNRFSLFDLFRPLAATTQPILINEKPVDIVSMNISFSPPVHWTYCVPSCGVNDQAVDADDAIEKARDDVVEAVHSSCTNIHIKCNMASVEIQYHPESVLTEDFGAYFDLSGNRYRISGSTIPYRINNMNPGIINSFVVPMKISFRPSSAISEKNAQVLKQKVVDYLAARKSLHITTNFY